MNSKVKILGKRLCSPDLRDTALLESVQSRFLLFIHLPASWREKLKRNWTFNSSATSLKFGQYNLLPWILTLLFLTGSEFIFWGNYLLSDTYRNTVNLGPVDLPRIQHLEPSFFHIADCGPFSYSGLTLLIFYLLCFLYQFCFPWQIQGWKLYLIALK